MLALALVAEPPPPKPGQPEAAAQVEADAKSKPAKSAPAWDANELRDLFLKIPAAEGAPTVEAKDSYLADLCGQAYRVPRQPKEATEVYAKRVLKKRDPDHPNVKKGQWLLALMRVFYDDASKRADTLGRFERDRQARGFFEAKAKEAKQVAEAIAGMIEIVVEGMEGFLAPLPIADGAEPEIYGAQAMVKDGGIVFENLERVRFENDAPSEKVARTAKGAIRELFSAAKQYNVSANMLGMYEAIWKKNKGNLRVVIPAASPAIYLNELVLGGVEGEMDTLRIMVMTQRGELRELKLALTKPKVKAKGKAKNKKPEREPTEVSCPNDVSMQKCVEYIALARKEGPVRYVVK